VTLTEVLLSEAESTYAVVERLFNQVSDKDLMWAPSTGKRWMTMGQLLMHCANFGCGKAIQGFITGDWGQVRDELVEQVHIPPAEALPSVRNVREALELLRVDRSLSISLINAAGEANLSVRNIAAPWGGPEISLFLQLLHMIGHLAQHKGQLFYYLKLMGRDVKTADLWGP